MQAVSLGALHMELITDDNTGPDFNNQQNYNPGQYNGVLLVYSGNERGLELSN